MGVAGQLPEPYSFLFTWFIVLPATFLVAQALTNLAIKDFLILRVKEEQHPLPQYLRPIRVPRPVPHTCSRLSARVRARAAGSPT